MKILKKIVLRGFFIVISIIILFLVSGFIFLFVFEPGPTKDDKTQRNIFYKIYGDKYSISYSYGQYIVIKPKLRGSISINESKEIYKVLFFSDYAQRKMNKSNYIFLNVYKNTGKWLFRYEFDYQVLYDPNKDELFISYQDFY